MTETDFERLTRLMLEEFKGLNDRLDRHDERFDSIDQRFDRLDVDVRAVRLELAEIRSELDNLAERVENTGGFRKEIDHALERIASIEKHLGIERRVEA